MSWIEVSTNVVLGALVITLASMVLRVLEWSNTHKCYEAAPGDVKSDVSFVRSLSIVGIVVGSLGVLRGAYDFYQIYYGGGKTTSQMISTSGSSLSGGHSTRFARYM